MHSFLLIQRTQPTDNFKNKFLSLFLFCFSPLLLHAQKYTISGYIKDGTSSESLIEATVYEIKSQKGTRANTYGFYSLTLPTDTVDLVYSYVGHESLRVRFFLKKDTVIQARLGSAALLEEVTVTGSRDDNPLESSRMGSLSISPTQIKAVPAFFGEVDVMKVLQLLPGVQSGEGSTGLYVRGGGPDQNLILLDGAPIYNASHLYGFFSTFNADAINHVELVKGSFPARYGGRLSSIIDIQMKEGNQTKLRGEASIGFVASRFTIEGPISKNRTSFIVSARRTLLNVIKIPILKKRIGGLAGDYYFYDVNAKVNHRINKNNRVYLSAYKGDDLNKSSSSDQYTNDMEHYESQSNSSLGWGNTILATRWNHTFSKKIFSNLAATYSKYYYQTASDISTSYTSLVTEKVTNQYYDFRYYSGIEDKAVRYDLEIIPGPSHYIRAGLQFTHHRFSPGSLGLTSLNEITSNNFSARKITALEWSGFAEDDWEITSRIKTNIGLHATLFNVDQKAYRSLQPRWSARYLLAREWSLKASLAAMQQFVHLLSATGTGLPMDLWVPATAKVKPQNSWQIATGAVRTVGSGYELTAEAYYKAMTNLIEYKDGASYLSTDQNWENKVESGKGNSYGIELLAKKTTGKLTGWLGYTLSKTSRQFDNLNDGKWFPYRYDRRHDVKLVLSYAWTERLNLGATWVYGTGNTTTLYMDRYSELTEPRYINSFDTRNNFRMRSYHRMDLSLNYTLKRIWLSHTFSFSIYNTYNRKNPFYIQFGYTDQGKRQLEQVSLFPILPSLTYSMSFK